MKNFKQIAEKCLSKKLSGTFIIEGDIKNYNSSYLSRDNFFGSAIRGRYVLGPLILNDDGHCVDDLRIKVINFIKDY